MKIFTIIFSLLIYQISFGQDISLKNCDSLKRNLKTDLIRVINRHDESVLIKMVFVGDHGEKIIIMTPEITLKGEIQQYYKIDSSLVKAYLDSIIMNNITFPLKDTIKFFNFGDYNKEKKKFVSVLIKVNQDSLNLFNRIPFKSFINKYFVGWSGQLKPEYMQEFGFNYGKRENILFMVCYLFDHYLILQDWERLDDSQLWGQPNVDVMNSKCFE